MKRFSSIELLQRKIEIYDENHRAVEIYAIVIYFYAMMEKTVIIKTTRLHSQNILRWLKSKWTLFSWLPRKTNRL